MTLADEWNTLPFSTQMRLPITAAIPYYYRWKLYQLKLMLNDLAYLFKQHKIIGAKDLYEVVILEAEELCSRLAYEINRIHQEREQLAETKTTV